MKNRLILFLTLTLILISLSKPATLWSQNVPDANFRAELALFGVTFDGLNNITNLPTAQAITNLFIGNKGISDLTGVEFLTGLITLNVEQNSLTSLNVSGLTNLEQLTCQLNPITSLNVTGCTALIGINALQCNISSSIDLSTNPNLASIEFFGNSLDGTLDLSANGSIATISVTGNSGLNSILLPSPASALVSIFGSSTALASFAPNAPNLETLFLQNCASLSSVSFTNTENIRNLTISGTSALTSVDVTMLDSLFRCYIFDCPNISTLNFSSNTILDEINVSNNGLTSLNLSTNPNIRRVFCQFQGSGTSLTSLTLPATGILEDVACFSNLNLSSINVSGHPSLLSLSVDGTGISLLNLSANINLTSIAAGTDGITSLDLSNNIALTSITLFGAPNLSSLSLPETTTLTDLLVVGTQITFLDVSGFSALTQLDIRNNPSPFFLVVSALPYVPPVTFFDNSPTASIKILASDLEVPDANFRTALSAKGVTFNAGNRVTNLPFVATIDSLILNGLNITNLKGINLFTSLGVLSCESNLLTSLDVSNNPLLQTIACNANAITSLDLSANTDLIELFADGNDLTAITLPSTTTLLRVRVSDNQLTSLDVSPASQLEDLRCSGNLLASLDVSSNAALTYLDCSLNDLTGSGLTLNNPNLTYLACGDNELTTLNVSSSPLLEELRCANNLLPSLDVTLNTSLTYLDFGGNPIGDGDIDLTNLTLLRLIYCNSTELTTLNLSGNPNLLTLRCFGSDFTSLDLSLNPLLEDLRCQDNALVSLDLSFNTSLQTLDCSFNSLTDLTLPLTTTLTTVICNDNLLTTLDLGNPTALIELACFNNQLTDLDITANTVLESLDIQGNPTPFFLTVSALPFPSGSVTTFFDTAPASYKIGPREVPDDGFRTILTSNFGINFDGSNFITNPSDAATITNLDVTFSGITDLRGLEAFVRVENLNVSNNSIDSINTSGNPFLRVLDCSENTITSITVDQNPLLEELYCNGNQLTSLELADLPALTTLNCSNNQLNILNTGSNPLLTTVIADINPLAIYLHADPAPSSISVNFGTLTDFLRSEILNPTITSGQTGGFVIENTGAIVQVTSNLSLADITLSTFAGVAPTINGALPVSVPGISADKYWSLTNPSPALTYTLILDLSPISGITNISTLQLLRRNTDADVWENVNEYGFVNFDFKGNFMIASNMFDFGEFAIGTLGDNPLPVELTSFTANATDTKVTLAWETASERDNQGFLLKRATSESGPFETIADYQTHPTLRGARNASVGKSYQFEDANGLKPGLNYHYKLYDVSYAGVATEHQPVSVRMPYQFSLDQNYPNPFNPTTTIRYQLAEAGAVQLKLYDVLGRVVATLVNERQEAGQYETRFNASSLSSGIYFYTIRAGNKIATKKMMLLK